MTLKITFDLADKDLKYFRDALNRARSAAEATGEQEILQKAAAMVEQVRSANVPAFVQKRLDRLNSLIDMVRDEEWALASKERRNVLVALAYFADPEDMISDDIPVLGYIDDAIMVELVVSELKPEIDAFEDFCRYRREEGSRNRNSNVSREQYLDMKRRQLHDRMRRRRSARRSGSAGSHRTRIRLF